MHVLEPSGGGGGSGSEGGDGGGGDDDDDNAEYRLTHTISHCSDA